jgi:hypothetical protein
MYRLEEGLRWGTRAQQGPQEGAPCVVKTFCRLKRRDCGRYSETSDARRREAPTSEPGPGPRKPTNKIFAGTSPTDGDGPRIRIPREGDSAS